MNTSAPLRATFDTNVCGLIADPAGYAGHDKPAGTAAKIQAALSSGAIQGFASEASVFIECLSFPSKLEYLAVAFTKGVRPAPDDARIRVFGQLQAYGVELLHAPLIAAERFITLPFAADVKYLPDERNERFGEFCKKYPRHEPLKEIGERRLRAKPLAHRLVGGIELRAAADWRTVFLRDWDEGDQAARAALRKEIGPIIGEWCDVLIVGAHYAYGNDVLVTTDQANGTGAGSIMHPSHRAALAADGIKIISPAEFAAML